MRAARIACALLAAVVCAWFALSARQAIDTSSAVAIVGKANHETATQAREVQSLVHGATLLNPDKQPDLLLARAALERGEDARARRLFEAVARSEPQNLEAWLGLGEASPHNQRLYMYALTRVRALEPRLPSG